MSGGFIWSASIYMVPLCYLAIGHIVKGMLSKINTYLGKEAMFFHTGIRHMPQSYMPQIIARMRRIS